MANIKFWKNWTIASKIGAVISIGIIASILVISIGGVGFLKKEYLATFGKQQFTTVQAFAMYLDAELSNRLKTIKAAAESMPPGTLSDPAEAQEFFSTRSKLTSLFDDGLMILSTEGILLAEVPFLSQERQGKDYSSSPFFQQVKKSASPVISEPFYSIKTGQHLAIKFMTPIHDEQGKISGYLCGGLTLNGDNVLGNIAKRKIGNNGYFYIYSLDRTILVHHDSTRTMQKDVPPGANRLFDLALEGFDGSGETINSRGLHFIASFQHLQTAPWILAANFPLQEALAPFNATRNLVIVTITTCGLAVILVSIWSLFRFMAPLNRFIAHMQKCGEDGSAFEHEGGPEVTRLTTIFNQMLSRIKESQAELRSNEELQRTLLNASPDIICFKDAEGRWLLANETALTLFQLQGVEYQGKKDAELAADSPFYRNGFMSSAISDEKAWEHGGKLTTEELLRTADQENRIFEVYRAPLFHPDGGRKAMVIIGHDISTRKQSEEIIWRQANFDSLTLLPNRRLFLYRLEEVISSTKRDNSSLALMFLDLDNFKDVNDTLGHDYGDLLLIEAAQRILDCVRETDTVSRFGGDEFVLLLTKIKLDVGIEKVTKKILAALNQAFYLKNEVVHISASIGVTIFPEDGDDISTLLKNADRAMYLAKNSGRNCWRSFTDVLKDSEQNNSI